MTADADRLAADWLDYCLRWARRAEERHGDPVGLYHNAAIDGLLKAIRTTSPGRATLNRAYLDQNLRLAGRNATQAERRRRRRLRRVEPTDDPPDPHPDRLGAADNRDELAATLPRLDPDSRLALICSAYDGLSIRRIERANGDGVGAVRYRIRRGTPKIKET